LHSSEILSNTDAINSAPGKSRSIISHQQLSSKRDGKHRTINKQLVNKLIPAPHARATKKAGEYGPNITKLGIAQLLLIEIQSMMI